MNDFLVEILNFVIALTQLGLFFGVILILGKVLLAIAMGSKIQVGSIVSVVVLLVASMVLLEYVPAWTFRTLTASMAHVEKEKPAFEAQLRSMLGPVIPNQSPSQAPSQPPSQQSHPSDHNSGGGVPDVVIDASEPATILSTSTPLVQSQTAVPMPEDQYPTAVPSQQAPTPTPTQQAPTGPTPEPTLDLSIWNVQTPAPTVPSN